MDGFGQRQIHNDGDKSDLNGRGRGRRRRNAEERLPVRYDFSQKAPAEDAAIAKNRR
jgi:hypothetical protein